MPLSSNPVKDTRFSTSELGFKSLWGHFKIYIKKYISKSIKFYYFTQRKFLSEDYETYAHISLGKNTIFHSQWNRH